MPNGTLPVTGYLGDENRLTSEFQGGIDELLAYVKTLKTEVDALSAQVIKEAAVRGVGDASGLLTDRAIGDTAGQLNIRGVGTGLTQLPDNNRLNTRLATTGNLGTAATKTAGSADGNVPLIEKAAITLSSFVGSPVLYLTKIGNFVMASTAGVFLETSVSQNSIELVGAIPAAFRPTVDAATISSADILNVYKHDFKTNGNFEARAIKISDGDFQPNGTLFGDVNGVYALGA